MACSSENITQKQAVISVKTTIRNSTQKPVTVTVLEKINLKGDSRIVATVKKQIKINAYTTETTNQKLQVRLPLLWSLSNPNLYEVQISILDNQKEIDHTTVQAGIRSVVFDPAKGFSLNGQSLKLKRCLFAPRCRCAGFCCSKAGLGAQAEGVKKFGLQCHSHQSQPSGRLCI